jgi:colanic acid/amylovoran biosynthesis glycosyltransferase
MTLTTLWARPVLFLAALRTALRLAHRAERRTWGNLMRLAEACALLHETQTGRIEHVHVRGGTDAATVALLCRGLGGPPFSFVVHGPLEFDKPQNFGLAEKIQGAAFVLADSAYGRSQLLRWCGHEHWDKVHIVRPVKQVDVAEVAASRSLPRSFGHTTHIPRFVCIGRLCESKGQRILVEAAALLAADGLAFEINFVGEGPLRNELEALVRLRGLSSRVRFVGAARLNDTRERIAGATAVVVPSLSEGLSFPALEAFAHGLPVVATAVAGLPELVEDGVNGWLVEPGSVNALADALREALVAPADHLAALGGAGMKRLSERHAPEVEVVRLQRLFGDSIASYRGRDVRRAQLRARSAGGIPKVSVVIVNWNRADDVVWNLRHLSRLDYPNLEILVIDNGSTDGSQERLSALPGVHLIRLESNLGPSRARNVGIQAATGKYIVFLDSDAVLAKRALGVMVARMEADPSIGIAGCKILNWHTRKIDQWIYAEPYETHRNTAFDSYSFSAAGAIARAEALRDVGGFWERLFIYNEEVDLSIRMLRGGYRIVFAPDARLVCWWKVTSYSAIYLIKGLANREPMAAVRGIVEGLRHTSIIDEYADDKLSYEEVGLIDSLNRRTAIRLRR